MKLTKGPLKAIIGGAAFLVCGVTALSTFVPSYRAYKEYYDAKMEEKRLNSLPLELLSIEANQIKDIYATGFDIPENDDFEVKANFTEKGKEFSKILPSSDFSITYGEDFSNNGAESLLANHLIMEGIDVQHIYLRDRKLLKPMLPTQLVDYYSTFEQEYTLLSDIDKNHFQAFFLEIQRNNKI